MAAAIKPQRRELVLLTRTLPRRVVSWAVVKGSQMLRILERSQIRTTGVLSPETKCDVTYVLGWDLQQDKPRVINVGVRLYRRIPTCFNL